MRHARICSIPSPVPQVSQISGRIQSAREEHVTNTGWRLVGRAAELATQLSPRNAVAAGRDEDVLFAARFRLRPRIGAGSVVNTVLTALSGAIRRHWQDAPPLTRDHPLSRPPERFHGLRWEVAGDADSWRGELVWRHPHPVIAGTPCTTHLVLTEHPGHTLLILRVTADDGYASVRGTVGAGQARPPFLSELNRSLRLFPDSASAEPRVLGEDGIADFVRNVLLSETREHPIAVLAPLEDGSYVLPPAELADELLGLAELHVLDRHPTTFRLTDTLGDRRLSCYWGALRVYLPEFSCADRPTDHPLLVRERLDDPVIRADLVGKLGRLARHRVQMPVAHRPDEEEQVEPGHALAPSTSIQAAHAGTPDPLDSAGSPPADQRAEHQAGNDSPGAATLIGPILSLLGDQIGALSATIAQLVDANSALAGEIERLRTTTSVRTASTTSLERRVVGLEQLLARHLEPAEPAATPDGEPRASAEERDDGGEEDEELSLLEALRQAATAHPDALLVLDPAERAATDSPYEDVDRVAVVLDAMAAIARRRQEGALGTPLRTAFRELGIEYRGAIARSTSGKMRQQYLVTGSDGQVYDCPEHIVLGSSHDPRFCLRIYFTSRAPVEPRFVIGHVGRHFEVATTT